MVVDEEGKRVRWQGRWVYLSPKEWEVFLLLWKNRGRVVLTEKFLDVIWEDKPVGDDVLRQVIYSIRKKLKGVRIVNVKGMGYVLEVEKPAVEIKGKYLVCELEGKTLVVDLEEEKCWRR